jgi:hypothetical protein
VNNKQATLQTDVDNYSGCKGRSSEKKKGCCNNKHCFLISLLLSIIIGCGLIILGVVIGVKKSASSSIKPVDSSQSTVEVHSQISSVF